MSLRFFICILLLPAIDVSAGETEQVVLHVKVNGTVPPLILHAGLMEASGIFRKSGIRITSYSSGLRAEPGTVENVDVLVRQMAPPGKNPSVLAYSLPYARSGVRVVVYYERIQELTSIPNPVLLGYALAHELGHVLMEGNSHSVDGVMKARWTLTDYSLMQARLLCFTDGEGGIMRQNLSKDRRREGSRESQLPVRSFPNIMSIQPDLRPAIFGENR